MDHGSQILSTRGREHHANKDRNTGFRGKLAELSAFAVAEWGTDRTLLVGLLL